MFFYESGYWTIRAVENATFDAPVGFDAQAIKLALNLIIWFTMRRCEIEAFRYLERFVNDDISKSENDEIDNVIRVMARVLCIPSNFRIEADNISAVS